MRDGLDRRGLGRAALAAGLITTLRLPPASASSSPDPASFTTSFTAGFDLAARSERELVVRGLTLTPGVTGPSGTGTPPEAGPVRLLSVTVLFANGTGDKASVSSQGRDLAVYSTLVRRSGSAVTTDAIGGVISRWADAVSAGASDSGTWLTYGFLGGDVQLDVGTEYYVAPISNDSVFTDATYLRGSSSTGLSGGTFAIGSTPSRVTSYLIFAQAAFA